MSSDLSSKCRTCLSDSNFFHQLFDYVDENYKILEMLDGVVPQIGIKSNTQFSTVICKPCVDKLLTSYKFQQLCLETNNRLHDLLGIAVFEAEPKVQKTLDPLTGEKNFKIKQEVGDDTSYERDINADELEMGLRSDHENDWELLANDRDTDSSNEKLSVLKERSTKKPPLKVEHLEKLNKIKMCINNFPCKECGKVLNSYYRLKRHKAMHAQKAEYPCETCNTTFAAEKTLKAHILTHKKEQNNSADVSSDQNESNEINDTKEFVDSKGNDDEVSKIWIMENMEDSDSEEASAFQCKECPKSFEKQVALSAHYKVHRKKHSNKLNNKDKNVEPKFEGNKTPDRKETAEDEEPNVFIKEELEITPQIFEGPMDELETNGEWYNNDNEDSDFVDTGIGEVEKPNISNKGSGKKSFPCEVCGKIFDRPYLLKRHSSVHCLTKPHECEICKYRFDTASILKAHLCKHKNDTIGNLYGQSRPEGFKCPDCPRRFEKQASLSAHRQIHTRYASEANYPCIVCQRKFMSARSLTEHIMRKHPEVEKHKCDQCDKTFVLHALLVEHLNRHKGNKNLVCLICEKEFCYPNTLIEHMRAHSGETPYLCAQCGKTFRTASNLRHHMERHTGLKKYQCPECPSRFNCRSDLIKHAIIHTNAKPHVCDICGSAFSRAFCLRKHKLLHSGERPFKCDQCSMTFAVVDHLRRHKRTHTGEKPYKCKYCERSYGESGDLIKHLRTHVGANTYICDQCPLAFKYQAELRQHQSEHYKMTQKQLQPAQKMFDKAQEHDINDSQQVQPKYGQL